MKTLSLFSSAIAFFLVQLSTFQAHSSSIEERLNQQFPFKGTALPDSSISWDPLDTLSDSPLPRVALYADQGAWTLGKEHLKQFFVQYSFPYKSLSKGDVLSGVLSKGDFDILIMPGGESWTYLAELGDEGAQIIKEFVAAGGGYVGICAGAFYATSMREGGVKTGEYGIGLLEGTAYDGTALGTTPFIEGMMDFSILLKGFPPIMRMVLLGGPSFRFSQSEQAIKSIETLSRFEEIHEPAMIRFRYGSGHVFLSGPHLEVEENSTNWGPNYHDPESDWPLLKQVMLSLYDQ